MASNGAGARAAPSALLPFQDLERLASRARWLFAGLILAVALLPGSVLMLTEVGHVRAYNRRDARQIALLVTAQLERSGLDLAVITGILRNEMEANRLISVRLRGPAEGGWIELGARARKVFPVSATVPIVSGGTTLGELTVEADAGPMLVQAGRIFGVFLLIAVLLALVLYRLPIRALRLAIHEAQAAQAQLIHADRLSTIGEMYAGLAHEINNPLGIILSRVRILLAGARDRGVHADLVRDLEMIDRHGTRIAEVIRGLLAFARKQTFAPAETDLNRVVGDVVALVEKPFAKQHIVVDAVLEPSLPALRASPDQLQQVVLNLVNNARDAMPAGGTITIRTRRDGDRLVVEVRDTGTGIAAGIQHRIFEPFFTTKDVGKGTGLGLSVSYGIVKAHGGDIEVESSPGGGAMFRIVLPPARRRA